MEYGNDDRSYNDSVEYRVITLPSVIVSPMKTSVVRGQIVVVKCRLNDDSNDDSASVFFWQKDGLDFTSQKDGLWHVSTIKHF